MLAWLRSRDIAFLKPFCRLRSFLKTLPLWLSWVHYGRWQFVVVYWCNHSWHGYLVEVGITLVWAISLGLNGRYTIRVFGTSIHSIEESITSAWAIYHFCNWQSKDLQSCFVVQLVTRTSRALQLAFPAVKLKGWMAKGSGRNHSRSKGEDVWTSVNSSAAPMLLAPSVDWLASFGWRHLQLIPTYVPPSVDDWMANFVW